MKRAHEVREILKAHVVGDLGDGTTRIEEHPDGQPEARADEILMRRRPRHASKDAQEVEGAESDRVGQLGERQWLPAGSFDAVQRVVDSPDVARMRRPLAHPSIAGVCHYGLRHQIGEFVDVDVLTTARLLHEGDDTRLRRQRAWSAKDRVRATRGARDIEQRLARDGQRGALVTSIVVVRALELCIRVTQEQPARAQGMGSVGARGAVAEGAAPHEGDDPRLARVHLGVRLVVSSERAGDVREARDASFSGNRDRKRTAHAHKHVARAALRQEQDFPRRLGPPRR